MWRDDPYGRTDRWMITSWRFENDAACPECRFDPIRVFRLEEISPPKIPLRFKDDERFAFAENFAERYELIEEWAAPLDDGKYAVGRDYQARIATFNDLDEAHFVLRILVDILNAPAGNVLCSQISPYLMKLFASFPEELAKVDIQTAKDNAKFTTILEQALLQEKKLSYGIHVYVFSFSNESVKIGISNNVRRRSRAIIGHSGLDMLQWSSTEGLNSDEARQIEKACHNHFYNRRTRGEFFNVTFDEACVYLQSQVAKPLMYGKGEFK